MFIKIHRMKSTAEALGSPANRKVISLGTWSGRQSPPRESWRLGRYLLQPIALPQRLFQVVPCHPFLYLSLYHPPVAGHSGHSGRSGRSCPSIYHLFEDFYEDSGAGCGEDSGTCRGHSVARGCRSGDARGCRSVCGARDCRSVGRNEWSRDTDRDRAGRDP